MKKGGALEVVEGELLFDVAAVDGGGEASVVGSVPVSNTTSSSKRTILSASFITEQIL